MDLALVEALDSIRTGAAGVAVPGIAVARFCGRRPIESAVVGCARFAADGRRCAQPLAADTLLRVASVSKLVVAIAVVRLSRRGVVDLDDDVSVHLGFPLRNPAWPDRPITLRQLLSHTSSLQDGATYWAPHPDTLRDVVTNPAAFDASHAPGRYFRYANLNYGVVATAIEHATGARFDAFMQTEVFAASGVEAGFNWSGLEALSPLRIGATYRRQTADGEWISDGPWRAQVDDFAGDPPRVLVHWRSGPAPPPQDYRVGTNGTLFAPHGGLRISVLDLVRLMQSALADGTLAAMAHLQWQLAADESNGDSAQGCYRAFGLGVQMALPGATIGHFGDAYGLKCGVVVDPASRRGWLYLINGTAAAPVRAGGPWTGLDTVESAVVTALGAPRN